MPRTSDAAVRAIIEIDSSVASTAPFIEAANNLVTRLCAPVVAYTDEDLELIERWLAAHFVAIRDPRFASEGVGGVSGSYQFRVGMNLNETVYGQQALVLDTSGNLAAASKRAENGKPRRVGMTYLGTTPGCANPIPTCEE